ncbi:unnamed protein product, partial [Staurois parvus]
WVPQAIGDHGAPVSLPTLKKAYEKGRGNLHLVTRDTQVFKLHTSRQSHQEGGLLETPPQGRTDNSWGPGQ